MPYYVNCQHYFYSGQYMVEIAYPGIDYAGSDMLATDYPGEGEYDDKGTVPYLEKIADYLGILGE